ncbi:hypothetical protein HYV11_03085 [Candidatus Dependentiae bacterium]|nr:hypothetical protein [Candidatus Dependentiae bacterium]
MNQKIDHSQLLNHNSHLWISNVNTLEFHLIKALQHILCSQKSNCSSCHNCLNISKKNHPWVTWLFPEISYNAEQISNIIDATGFLLDKEEKRFFIFTKAHELNITCSNRLLKTIEEPHRGYYFIFLTNRPQDIVQTLKSRCFIQTFPATIQEELYQEITQPFISMTFNDPIQFIKLIDKQQIKEATTREIIDLLIQYFNHKLKESILHNDKNNQLKQLECLLILKKALLQMPLQGSSKLFWKNLYLAFSEQALC